METRMIVLACALGIAASIPAAEGPRKKAAEKKVAAKKVVDTYRTPEEAAQDPDFAVQGEYAGEVKTAAGREKLGVQVVALGGGKFDAVLYRGGLPGAGWRLREKASMTGARRGDRVVLGDEKSDACVIEDGALRVIASGAAAGTLARVARKSPTLGAKPPAGAFVLFDGTSADAFRNGRMDEDKLLVQGMMGKRDFGDQFVHIEFRLPFEPAKRGQGRGNSGMYLQGRYEVQMLDSFGLEGRHDECGGIYTTAPPRENMCFPPLSWQTYDVKFLAPRFDASGKKTANAKMTVWHNGVLVHENVEVKGPTTAAPFNDEKPAGPLFLQDHGHPVRYRNIWIVEGDVPVPLEALRSGTPK
ncbi:MAG: DUF1080 domain-containing protein [Planctomycetes bacterium]|nr:DUF1080 domain-containing protein [Planctomycetota bacterium]